MIALNANRQIAGGHTGRSRLPSAMFRASVPLGKRDLLNVSACRLLVFGPQAGQHAVVFQRRGVADGLAAGGDVAQQPPHDLAAAGFRQRGGEVDVVGHGQWCRSPCGRGLDAFRNSSDGSKPPLRVTKTVTALPLRSWGRPTAAASATAAWLTRALSISIVLRRWPDTFSTLSDPAHDPVVPGFVAIITPLVYYSFAAFCAVFVVSRCGLLGCRTLERPEALGARSRDVVQTRKPFPIILGEVACQINAAFTVIAVKLV